MIMINGTWEYANSLEDISKIIRENFSYELADVMDSMLPDYSLEDYYELETACSDAEINVRNLEDELDYYENRVEELEEKVKELENK